MSSKTTEVFQNAPIPKAVLSNVIPSIISMIMVLVYNLADTFFYRPDGQCIHGCSSIGCDAHIPAVYGNRNVVRYRRNFADFPPAWGRKAGESRKCILFLFLEWFGYWNTRNDFYLGIC